MANNYDSPVVVDLARGMGRMEPPRRPEQGAAFGRQAATTAAEPERMKATTAVAAAEGAATRQALDKVRDFVQVVQRDLEFSVDDETGRSVVRVIDTGSGETIRQIPSEQILRIAENLDEVNGILFRGSA